MYVSALKTNDSFFAYNINKLVNEWKDENEAINANSMTHLKDNSGQMDTDDEPIFESPGNDVLVYRCIQSDTTESGRSFEELELLFSDIPTDELQQIVDALCEQGRCHTTCDMKHFKCPDGWFFFIVKIFSEVKFPKCPETFICAGIFVIYELYVYFIC